MRISQRPDAIQASALQRRRSFLLYWKPQFVDEFLESRRPLRHIGSWHFRRVLPGDEIWIVTLRRGTELSLVGHFAVFRCADLLKVRAEFPGEEVWPSRYQVISPRPESLRDLDISAVAGDLRFVSPRDRLKTLGANMYSQQLQTMRELSEASADMLRDIWTTHKSRSRRNLEFVRRP